MACFLLLYFEIAQIRKVGSAKGLGRIMQTLHWRVCRRSRYFKTSWEGEKQRAAIKVINAHESAAQAISRSKEYKNHSPKPFISILYIRFADCSRNKNILIILLNAMLLFIFKSLHQESQRKPQIKFSHFLGPRQIVKSFANESATLIIPGRAKACWENWFQFRRNRSVNNGGPSNFMRQPKS